MARRSPTAMGNAWGDADLAARAQIVGRVYQRITVADGAMPRSVTASSKPCLRPW
jgi:hypothetical protein